MIAYKDFCVLVDWDGASVIGSDFGLPGTNESELLVERWPLYSDDSIDIHKAHDSESGVDVLIYRSLVGYGCVAPHGSREDALCIAGWGDDVLKCLVGAGIIESDYLDEFL